MAEPPVGSASTNTSGRGQRNARATAVVVTPGEPDADVLGCLQPTVAELAMILIDAVGVDVEPQFSGRDVIASRRAADVTRARDVLGFEATIPVRDGMTELIRGGG